MKLKPIKANMTELHLANGDVVLFSYETPVAARTMEGPFKTDKHWSATTTRHINAWGGKEWPTRTQAFFDGLI